MITIKLKPTTGSFAENKDIAKNLRIKKINPALKKGDDVELDFYGIDSTTQSFIHSLISQLIRHYGADVLEKIHFKNCNDTVQKIIEIVTDYMQFRE
jgi:hypothetical protein